jgi:hypothetical protein
MRKVWMIAAQILCAACSDSSGPQPATPASLTFNNPPAAIVPGEQVTLDVTARTSAGAAITSPTIEWSSSNNGVATVSAAGVLNGLAVGSATITARTGAVSKTHQVDVIEGSIISAAGGTISALNGTMQLVVPAGAVAQNVRVHASTVPIAGGPDPSLVQGTVYVLTLTPAVTFAGPIALTVRYDPERAPIGVQEKDLGVAISEGVTWRSTGTATVDTLNNLVTANITQGGSYAVHRPSPASSCDAPEHRQFDFWLGEWDVDGVHSSITRDPVGCTIYEVYRSLQVGRSISFYDAVSKQWHQTYLFGQSNPPLRMSGGMEGNRMVMYVRDAGGELRQRWTWFVNADGTVTQRNEGTQNNGLTWTVGFNGTYRRR